MVALVLLTVLLTAGALAEEPKPERVLYRSQAQRFKRAVDVAQRGARTSVHHFLQDRQQSLVVPVEVDVYLVGLSGDGGFGYHLDATKLVSLLSTALGPVCPALWESHEELGICFQPTFQVVGAEEAPELGSLLRQLEAAVKGLMAEPGGSYQGNVDPLLDSMNDHWVDPTPQPGPGKDPGAAGDGAWAAPPEPPPPPAPPRLYSVEASRLEPIFDAFLAAVYAGREEVEAAGRQTAQSAEADRVLHPHYDQGAHAWHRHNAIFVINPSKVRMDPKGNASAQGSHESANFFKDWQNRRYDFARLEAEAGGYSYRYAYNGAGGAASWQSSRSYAVLDLAAGPSLYGPAAGRGGAVGRGALPQIKDVLFDALLQITGVPDHSAAQEAAAAAAARGAANLLAAPLASSLLSAARHLFMPDLMSDHIEAASRIVVPIVLLADHDTGLPPGLSYYDNGFYGIDIQAIETSLVHLLDEHQDAVVLTAVHSLHEHRQLAAALHKAMRSNARPVHDPARGDNLGGDQPGVHTQTSRFVEPDALLREFALASDMLTHGVMETAAVGQTAAFAEGHPLGPLRHTGTRVVPVFVVSLMHPSDDIVLPGHELVAANHDAVVVLQLRRTERWGVVDDTWSGHIANGERVMVDAVNVTRHVIAGLAQALAGVAPPYERYNVAEERQEHDWRWAVGATPFGPYSNFSGVSDIMAGVARRNMLVAHAHAALRHVQGGLDEADALVSHYFSGPWEAAGLGEGRAHWLHASVAARHGFNASLSPDDVLAVEQQLAGLGRSLQTLSVQLFTHDFKGADEVVATRLLPEAADVTARLAALLEAAEDVMRCCTVRHASALGQLAATFAGVGAAGGVFVLLLLVGLCGRRARQRTATAIGLPTHGLPDYSGMLSRGGSGASGHNGSRRASAW